MNWIALIFAGLFEMSGVLMINKWHKEKTITALTLLVVGFGISFLLLSYALKTLPMGTAYAIWTGIGTAGGTLLGMIFYGESRNRKRLVFIGLILGSAVGLKLIS
ncbi:transporter [Enterococcus sp. JM4C]|uniref:DMT family transporter n=1 Tax=Candidatus Enterococcus huntleyi TaxID=1857217 RepID=UPI00137B8D57|nr:multidrug efflux SMR transporter [Enterococcus sp. JM4C]KAF1298141.1 transporter [Enterococcus sp. JM4C]